MRSGLFAELQRLRSEGYFVVEGQTAEGGDLELVGEKGVWSLKASEE